MTRARIAVLASGGGSNLQAVLDHLAELGERRAGDVVLVASDRRASGALARAASVGIRTAVLQSAREPHESSLGSLLDDGGIDLVVLAGYLRMIPPEVTQRFAGRMLNVHPALLPAFGGAGMYGIHVHRAVLAARATQSGPTVHFVDEHYDHGAIIAQWPVPVRTVDDESALASRVLRAEHLLYPRVVQRVAAGRIQLGTDGRVHPSLLHFDAALPTFDPELDDRSLAARLDDALS